MVQNNRLETGATTSAALDAEALSVDPPLLNSGIVSPTAPEQLLLSVSTPDPAVTLAEAERWLEVIPPTAACYRLLELGILRRDVSLLEGLLSVLREP